MKRIIFLISLTCLAAYAQQPAQLSSQPKLFERFESKADDGVQTLRFFDEKNVVSSEIVIDKTGRINIHTSDGQDAWIQLESVKEDRQTVNTITTSAGKTMKVMLEYSATDATGPRGLKVKRFNGSEWEEISKTDLPKLATEEKNLFETKELSLMFALLKSVNGGKQNPGIFKLPMKYETQKDSEKHGQALNRVQALAVAEQRAFESLFSVQFIDAWTMPYLMFVLVLSSISSLLGIARAAAALSILLALSHVLCFKVA